VPVGSAPRRFLLFARTTSDPRTERSGTGDGRQGRVAGWEGASLAPPRRAAAGQSGFARSALWCASQAFGYWRVAGFDARVMRPPLAAATASGPGKVSAEAATASLGPVARSARAPESAEPGSSRVVCDVADECPRLVGRRQDDQGRLPIDLFRVEPVGSVRGLANRG
jgi:hypothetical protein